MLTVLIAEKEHIDAIQKKNNLFFEPFLDNKELAFCCWNTEGQSLKEAVPRLADTVGREKDWRAVIIGSSDPDLLKKHNPFDVVDHAAVAALETPDVQPENGETMNEWEGRWKAYYAELSEEKGKMFANALEQPLTRLGTWLCFRPEDYLLAEVQEKEDAEDWAMRELGKDEMKYSSRVEEMERKQYKCEIRMKEHLRREFVAEENLNIAYPSEVHCVSMRTSANGFFDPDTYWNVRMENEYSAFADRNMYFDKMRFLLFDLPISTHRNFRNEYVRFLASVLIFSCNQVPGSAMQARKLYRIETEVNETPLCMLVTSYDKKLAATAEILENEIEKMKSEIPDKLTDKAADAMFCTPKDVEVPLDATCEVERALVGRDYGLFFDSPENEYHKWRREFHSSEKEIEYMVKQQERSIRKSMEQVRMAGESADVNVSRLTEFQIEDIRNYTDGAEDDMVARIPKDFADISGYKARMQQESDKVENVIRQRMTKKTAFTLGGVTIVLCVLCFLPFLISNRNTVETSAVALVLCGSVLAVLLADMFLSLIFLRKSVRDAVKDYNEAVNAIILEIKDSLKKLSEYLSAFSNVRRGHVVQELAKKNVDLYTRGLRIRRKHQEDIRRKRAYLAEDYRDYIRNAEYWDETMIHPYQYDFGQNNEYPYPAPFLSGDFRQIEFISNGNYVKVPFSYVERIVVRQEEVYDK